MPEALRGIYRCFAQADIRKPLNSDYDAAITPLAEAVRDDMQKNLVPDRRLSDVAGVTGNFHT